MYWEENIKIWIQNQASYNILYRERACVRQSDFFTECCYYSHNVNASIIKNITYNWLLKNIKNIYFYYVIGNYTLFFGLKADYSMSMLGLYIHVYERAKNVNIFSQQVISKTMATRFHLPFSKVTFVNAKTSSVY